MKTKNFPVKTQITAGISGGPNAMRYLCGIPSHTATKTQPELRSNFMAKFLSLTCSSHACLRIFFENRKTASSAMIIHSLLLFYSCKLMLGISKLHPTQRTNGLRALGKDFVISNLLAAEVE